MRLFSQMQSGLLILLFPCWRFLSAVDGAPIEANRNFGEVNDFVELPGLKDPATVQYHVKDSDNSFLVVDLRNHQFGSLARASPTWSYSDPGSWSSSYPSCGGQRQSPVNLQQATTTAYPKLKFGNYGNIDKMTVTNNGHTVLFSLPTDFSSQFLPYISDGGFNNQYSFVQFHLHWGSDSSKGSEHLIRSRRYAAELHLVHYNTKYPSYAEATNHDDGLAVLGIFLKVSGQDNPAFQPLVEQLSEVINDGDEATLQNLVSFNKLLPSRTTSFYRYLGSLTTPGCQEIVTWTVFDTPVSISENQLSKFRSLKNAEGDTLVNNFRPTQPLDGRMITYRNNVGCALSQNWPISSNPFLDAFQYATCVTSFYRNSFLSLFGLGST